jgi:competence protein ComEA
VGAYLLRRFRSLKREVAAARTQPAPTIAEPVLASASSAAAVPPAPAPDVTAASPVDLNRATRSELLTVPGIGPKAAERIIAYREEFGAFRSLGDLEKVEGFSAKRIEALRDRFTTG